MFGLSSPELFERWEGETASVIAAGVNGTWNKWANDLDLPRPRARLGLRPKDAGGATPIYKSKNSKGERGRTIGGPVYAVESPLQGPLKKKRTEVHPNARCRR
jgi:hypothetical protein